MGALEEILRCQDNWARGRGLSPTERGYLPTVRENLFIPLCPDTVSEFTQGAGCELDDRTGEPAKMRALHSSAALVCNVFEYWRQTDRAVIGQVLGIPDPLVAVHFEKPLRTGLRGTAPTLDLLLVGKDDLAWGVEAKFTEPYGSTAPMHRLTGAYFPPNRKLWADLGLPCCQHLAEQIQDGHVAFKRLDACQLLKHSLGLRRQYRNGQLLMLWYGLPSAEGDEIASAIAAFAATVDPSLGFRAIEYNCLFSRLTREPAASPAYLAYLLSRYSYPPPADAARGGDNGNAFHPWAGEISLMKNQYFGDINDYRKYGLLRILATHAGVSIGVCWLLTEDDRQGNEELRAYLSKPARWRRFDTELYDKLQDLLKPDVPRRVTLAKGWGLIPSATYFEEVLGDGAGRQTTYFARANTVLEDCDLWFYDPDIGIEVDSIPPGRAGSSKYVYWTELQNAFQRGHSLLIYQHFPRVNRDRFVPFLATRLAEELGSRHVVGFRTAHVAFLLVGQERHADNLGAAAAEVGARWPNQIKVWRPPDEGDVNDRRA